LITVPVRGIKIPEIRRISTENLSGNSVEFRVNENSVEIRRKSAEFPESQYRVPALEKKIVQDRA
jgi:hypothetical protein